MPRPSFRRLHAQHFLRNKKFNAERGWIRRRWRHSSITGTCSTTVAAAAAAASTEQPPHEGGHNSPSSSLSLSRPGYDVYDDELGEMITRLSTFFALFTSYIPTD